MELLSVIVFIGNLILIPLIILSCERRIKEQEKITGHFFIDEFIDLVEEIETLNSMLEDEIEDNNRETNSYIQNLSNIMEEAQRRG